MLRCLRLQLLTTLTRPKEIICLQVILFLTSPLLLFIKSFKFILQSFLLILCNVDNHSLFLCWWFLLFIFGCCCNHRDTFSFRTKHSKWWQFSIFKIYGLVYWWASRRFCYLGKSRKLLPGSERFRFLLLQPMSKPRLKLLHRSYRCNHLSHGARLLSLLKFKKFRWIQPPNFNINFLKTSTLTATFPFVQPYSFLVLLPREISTFFVM